MIIGKKILGIAKNYLSTLIIRNEKCMLWSNHRDGTYACRDRNPNEGEAPREANDPRKKGSSSL